MKERLICAIICGVVSASCAMEVAEPEEKTEEESQEPEGYTPPDNGHPDRTQGSGTR